MSARLWLPPVHAPFHETTARAYYGSSSSSTNLKSRGQPGRPAGAESTHHLTVHRKKSAPRDGSKRLNSPRHYAYDARAGGGDGGGGGGVARAGAPGRSPARQARNGSTCISLTEEREESHHLRCGLVLQDHRPLSASHIHGRVVALCATYQAFFYCLGHGDGESMTPSYPGLKICCLGRSTLSTRLMDTSAPCPVFTVAEHDNVGVGVDEHTDELRELAKIMSFLLELSKGGTVLGLQTTLLSPSIVASWNHGPSLRL
uniref:Uncharacterized protein n=1 Tax=Oryza brachyantha TaxID=4533 RepID=J3M6R3_ORYBR